MELFPTYFAIFSMKQKTFKRRTRPDMIECDRKRVVVFLVITTVDNFDEKQEMSTIAAKVANRCQLFSNTVSSGLKKLTNSVYLLKLNRNC